VGTVLALFRYPVKSTAGEALDVAEVDARGLVGDRTWAAYTQDGGIASGKTTRRFRKVDGLLAWRSSRGTSAGAEESWLHEPEGGRYRVGDPAADAALSTAFGLPLRLRQETTSPHHDDCGVHLVTTSALRTAGRLAGGAVEARRARPNIVLETDGAGFLEDGWEGAELALGPEVVLRLGPGMPRCVMVDQPQHDLGAATPVLRTLGREHDLLLGIQAEVVATGTVRSGQEARLLRP
jgi:uncharacterized protein YcbX